MPSPALLPIERVESRILLFLGQKVMLSTHLAVLYRVPVRSLIQALKRNRARLPPDFMFQLNAREFANLKSQFVISRWGGARRARPYAFTEQGVAMLSSVLRGRRAALVNVQIMRAFVRLRCLLASHAELRHRLEALELNCDANFKAVFETLRDLTTPPLRPRPRIGFRPALPGGGANGTAIRAVRPRVSSQRCN